MAWIVYFAFFIGFWVQAGELSPAEGLRIRLQTLLNDTELTLRNRNSARQGELRQARDLQYLKVFERIPLQENREALGVELSSSAVSFGVQLLKFECGISQPPSARVPRVLYTDDPPFEPQLDQLARAFPLHLEVRGNPKRIQDWIKSWPTELLRWVEPFGEIREIHGTHTEGVRWIIDARAYAFQRFRPPLVSLRDPLSLLPTSARKDPQTFARKEPALWKLITEIQARRSEALVQLHHRGQVLLDRARLNAYLEKVR